MYQTFDVTHEDVTHLGHGGSVVGSVPCVRKVTGWNPT